MKISSKSEYGIRALFDLAQHHEQNPRRSREIGEAQNIPEDYLNQLLINLRRAGLINSLRGPQGGHVLAKAPNQINLYEVVRVLEGDISPVAHDAKHVDLDDILIDVWKDIETETTRILQATNLEDLCTRFSERKITLSESMYYI